MPWLTLGAPEASVGVIYSLKPKSMLFFTLEPWNLLLLDIFVFAVCDAIVSKPAISCNFYDLNVLLYT